MSQITSKLLKPASLVFALVLAIAFLAAIPQQAKAAEETEMVPIYRLYHPGNYEHLFTSDSYERDVLAANGWVDEGIAWYAPDADSADEGVYRLYNPVLNNHLYTTDQNEVRELTTKDVWELDNDGEPLFYSGGDESIYRLYNGANPALNGQHLLTTDEYEYDVLALPENNSWTQEGVALKAVALADDDTVYYDITNVDSYCTIEADVTLSGTGTGYHAKLCLLTADAGVSFGLQYDQYAASPYTGQTRFLIENIKTAEVGGDQTYTRVGGEAKKNTTYHLMLTLSSTGVCRAYVNGVYQGYVVNENLVGQAITLRVEACGRLEGDTVSATFSNIKLKNNGVYSPTQTWATYNASNNVGMSTSVEDDEFFTSEDEYEITISGTVKGIGDLDWDSAANSVSGIVQFWEPQIS